MIDLMDMLDRDCSKEQLVQKIYEMRSSGELNEILQLVERAKSRQDSAFDMAENISLQYFGCTLDLWYCVEDAFWIRKKNASVFESVVLYPQIDGFYFGFYFEVDVSQFTAEEFDACMKACPPPDNLCGVELRKMYSVFRSRDIESANDKLTTENEKIKNLWLKKYGINGEVKS